MTPPCLCNSLKTLPFINPRSSRHDNVLSSPAETVQPRAARQTCTAAKVMQGRLNAAIRTFLKTLRTVSCRCAQVHQPGKVLNSNEYPTGAFARIGSQPDSDCAVYPFQTVSISFSYPPVFQQKQLKSRYDRLREQGFLRREEMIPKLGVTYTQLNWLQEHNLLCAHHAANKRKQFLYEIPSQKQLKTIRDTLTNNLVA